MNVNRNPLYAIAAAAVGGTAFRYLTPATFQDAALVCYVGGGIMAIMAILFWHRIMLMRISMFLGGLIVIGMPFTSSHAKMDPNSPAIMAGIIIYMICSYFDERTKRRARPDAEEIAHETPA